MVVRKEKENYYYGDEIICSHIDEWSYVYVEAFLSVTKTFELIDAVLYPTADNSQTATLLINEEQETTYW